MKIIKSLELLLYELMVWFVFYPRTLWLAVTRPLKLMEYADAELDDDDDDRYSDTLSPPIFLAITLGLVHLVEVSAQLGPQTDGILADDKNLIAFRIVAFAIFPLVLSLNLLRAKRIALDRKTLRSPFYAQCFVVVPFALLIDIAALLWTIGVRDWRAGAIFALAFIWYGAVQTLWFRRSLSSGWLRAALLTLGSIVLAIIVMFIIGMAVDRI